MTESTMPPSFWGSFNEVVWVSPADMLINELYFWGCGPGEVVWGVGGEQVGMGTVLDH